MGTCWMDPPSLCLQDRPTLERPMYLQQTDRHIFLSSQASQPHYFKIQLGVIFLSCPINMGDDVISDGVSGRSQAAIC
jgi:hypothetical protein